MSSCLPPFEGGLFPIFELYLSLIFLERWFLIPPQMGMEVGLDSSLVDCAQEDGNRMSKPEEPWAWGSVSEVTYDLWPAGSAKRQWQEVCIKPATFPSGSRSQKVLSFHVWGESCGLFLLLKSCILVCKCLVPSGIFTLAVLFNCGLKLCVESGRCYWGGVMTNKVRFSERKARRQGVYP